MEPPCRNKGTPTGDPHRPQFCFDKNINIWRRRFPKKSRDVGSILNLQVVEVGDFMASQPCSSPASNGKGSAGGGVRWMLRKVCACGHRHLQVDGGGGERQTRVPQSRRLDALFVVYSNQHLVVGLSKTRTRTRRVVGLPYHPSISCPFLRARRVGGFMTARKLAGAAHPHLCRGHRGGSGVGRGGCERTSRETGADQRVGDRGCHRGTRRFCQRRSSERTRSSTGSTCTSRLATMQCAFGTLKSARGWCQTRRTKTNTSLAGGWHRLNLGLRPPPRHRPVGKSSTATAIAPLSNALRSQPPRSTTSGGSASPVPVGSSCSLFHHLRRPQLRAARSGRCQGRTPDFAADRSQVLPATFAPTSRDSERAAGADLGDGGGRELRAKTGDSRFC